MPRMKKSNLGRILKAAAMANRGSTIYLGFMSDLLASEESRKASLEARGIAVITTSGALVSLLLGLITAIKGSKTFIVSASAYAPFLVGGVLFGIAATLGILANVPFLYKSVRPTSLEFATYNLWDDSPEDAELMVASTRIGLYASARKTNTLKAIFVIAGLTAEVAALIPVAIAVSDVLHAKH
jgi:hypothetical protein